MNSQITVNSKHLENFISFVYSSLIGGSYYFAVRHLNLGVEIRDQDRINSNMLRIELKIYFVWWYDLYLALKMLFSRNFGGLVFIQLFWFTEK